MLGADRDPTVIDEMIIPPEAWGVRCISIGYFVPEGQAVIWRGPMLHKALEQFLTDVFWDEPDFLLIDMPPGTGDIALSLVAVPAPRRGVRRHHTAAGRPEGRRAVGGDGGQGQPPRARRDREHVVVHRRRRQAVRDLRLRWRPGQLADDLGVPMLGRLPLMPELREGGDDGKPITAVDPESEAAQMFHEIARQIAVDMKPKKVYSDALKVN